MDAEEIPNPGAAQVSRPRDIGEPGHRPLDDVEHVITGTECNMPGCYRRTSGRYCELHNSSSLSSPIDDFEPPSETSDLFGDPSRRELQRQLDRLEGKVDALVAALNADVDDE